MSLKQVADLDLKKDGILHYRGFLSPSKAAELRDEVLTLLQKPQFNGSLGGLRVSKHIRQVSFPCIAIHSVNLLELSLDVLDVIQKNAAQPLVDPVLTNLQIFSEAGNEVPLFWHTDARQGMIRAQIYLRGGKESSGAFQFMLGTHLGNHGLTHKVPPELEEKLRSKIYTAVGEAGDLVVFDSYGFHAKTRCEDERINVMIEFQSRKDDSIRSAAYISSGLLTDRVLKNISVFTAASKAGLPHGIENHFAGEIFPGIQAGLFMGKRILSHIAHRITGR